MSKTFISFSTLVIFIVACYFKVRPQATITIIIDFHTSGIVYGRHLLDVPKAHYEIIFLIVKLVIVAIVNILVLYESTIGLFQLMGLITPTHDVFAVTGSLSNPGPYGGLMAILLAILGVYVLQNRNAEKWYDRMLVMLSSVSCAMCVIILPASMSRAAWLALGVAAFVFGFKELNLADWMRMHIPVAVVASVMVVIAMTGIFFLKKDSAIGRLHIWHMELRAIAEKPWTGHGAGTVLGVYGDTQAEYFAEKERSAIITKVAGCPEYAFNEYLKIGVEHGIPAMLSTVAVLLSLITVLLKFHSPFAYGLIAFSVFAFFSYPLEAVDIKSDAERKWENIRFFSGMGLYENAAEELAPLYEDLKENCRYLYDYGYALHKCKRYRESTRILMEGATISSDPMFYNIMGRNFEALCMYEDAGSAYIHAHHMVPQRLYPLTLLMRMNIRLGNNEEALRYGRIISSKPVNDRNRTMLRLQSEASHCVDSLKSLDALK